MAVLNFLKSAGVQSMICKSLSTYLGQPIMENILTPPNTARGMKILDRDLLKKTITVPCLDVEGIMVDRVLKLLRSYILKLPNFKPVVPREQSDNDSSKGVEQSNVRRIYLNPNLVSNYLDFSEPLHRALYEYHVKADNLKHTQISLTYENWKPEELFRAILPLDCNNFSSYSIIGHIIHLNLKDCLLEYKHVIGQILLDKIPNCKSVVNKTDSVSNEYRTFNMEVLCGSEDLITRVKENNNIFEFNFRNVYWNPRLCTEHARIISKLKKNDVLFDVFAGVGPFAVPAGKICSRVYANDLNPASYDALRRNIFLNNVESRVEPFNKDAKLFILEDFKRTILLLSQDPQFRASQIHIVMNLPDSAVTFLKYFVGLFSPSEISMLRTFTEMFLVHVYCFVKTCEENEIELAEAVVKSSLKIANSLLVQESTIVRNVSPNKEMIRVSFFLTESLLKNRSYENYDPPPPKRFCGIVS